ncbi:hypothetical protein F2P79_007380, partial [Pimephales promelas]
LGTRELNDGGPLCESQCIQFWMDHFEQLKEDEHFVDTFIDKSLIQFCFQHFIQ